MPLTFLIDEQLRGHLRRAVRLHNVVGINVIDALWVGEPADLPLGSKDPDILIWSEANARIVVCFDPQTMPGYFQQHLKIGRHSPGVLMLRPGARIDDIIQELALIAHAGFLDDYFDQIRHIP